MPVALRASRSVGLRAQALSTRLVAPELMGFDQRVVDELDPVTATALRRLVRGRSVVQNLPIAIALGGFAAVTVDPRVDADHPVRLRGELRRSLRPTS
jgi:hypothetical protein